MKYDDNENGNDNETSLRGNWGSVYIWLWRVWWREREKRMGIYKGGNADKMGYGSGWDCASGVGGGEFDGFASIPAVRDSSFHLDFWYWQFGLVYSYTVPYVRRDLNDNKTKSIAAFVGEIYTILTRTSQNILGRLFSSFF